MSGVLFKVNVWRYFPSVSALLFPFLQHYSGTEQQVWLPAAVPDDLLRMAASLQPSALRAASPLQRGARPLRHPPGVCQGEGDAHHSGRFQGRWDSPRPSLRVHLLQTNMASLTLYGGLMFLWHSIN